MKQNAFYLLLFAGIVISNSVTYAQENNYISSKYDFIPGEKVIFFDDFVSENIGDFPAQWLTNGSGEIVTLEKFPNRWFHLTKGGYYIPEAKEEFTDNFTIEFDFVPMTTDNSETIFGISFYLLTGKLSEPGGGGEPGDAGFQLALDNENLGWKNWSMETEQRFNGNVSYPFRSGEIYHVAIWVQKQRLRFYSNATLVLDVPLAVPAGSKPNIFRFDSRDEAIPLISNFRIATTKSLSSQGKVQLTDIEGNKYKTVEIGPQTWMAENLRTTIYNDGTAIPLVADSSKWRYREASGYCWFKNDPITYKIYGPLYNWYVVKAGNLCPLGWHVPTIEDWTALSDFLMDNADAGGKLKEKGTAHWKTPNTGATDETRFTALPGGGRDDSGEFGSMFIGPVGEAGSWWSSSEDLSESDPATPDPPTNAYGMLIKYNFNVLFGGTYPKDYGMSVRCLKN